MSTRRTQFKNPDDIDAVYKAVIRFLAVRMRSEQEVLKYLGDRGAGSEISTTILTRLRDFKFLDDEKFAQSWCNSRIRVNRFGRIRIRMELQQKGIVEDIITDVLNAYSKEDEMRNAVTSLVKKYGNSEIDQKIHSRMFSFLSRRGYTQGIIYDAIKQATNQGQSTQLYD